MTTEAPNADTSATPTKLEDRSDEFLRSFQPSRITPLPDKWPANQSQWTDYDFRSLDEFVRWSNLRFLAMKAEAALPHKMAKKQRIGDK